MARGKGPRTRRGGLEGGGLGTLRDLRHPVEEIERRHDVVQRASRIADDSIQRGVL